MIRFQANQQATQRGGDLIYSIPWAFFLLFCNEGETHVCAEKAVAILLSRLAVAWLIVLKQLDEAIASVLAQLKYGQAA